VYIGPGVSLLADLGTSPYRTVRDSEADDLGLVRLLTLFEV